MCLASDLDPSRIDTPELATRPVFFKLAEWSEQLRSVTSVRLGVVRRRVQIRLCTEQRVREKKTCLDLFPRLDLC